MNPKLNAIRKAWLVFEEYIERKLGGHINIGKRITIFGANAMHWGVNIHTNKYGYICFRLPLRCFGGWWPLYFYCSPNATPWASTFYLGESRDQRMKAKIRKYLFGHNYRTRDPKNERAMRKINSLIFKYWD